MTVEALLQGETAGCVMPVLRHNGGDEQALRKYVNVIHESGAKVFCLESREHPEFCGEKWWHDLSIILEEARKLGMQVWLGDDKGNRTALAAGAVDTAPEELLPRRIYSYAVEVKPGNATLSLDLQKLTRKIPSRRKLGRGKNEAAFARPVSLCALVGDTAAPVIPEWEQTDAVITVFLPEDTRKVYVTFSARDPGHRGQLDLLNESSCKLLINAVYEPHFSHFGEDFGKTVAGFFSREPALGYTEVYEAAQNMGQSSTYPWNEELKNRLQLRWGEAWAWKLPLLWHGSADEDEVAAIRMDFQDEVTALAERCFAEQLRHWCKEHGVGYFLSNHRDAAEHNRLDTALGNWFRGMCGDVATVSVCSGELLPGKDEGKGKDWNYSCDRYLAGYLAASSAALDPDKQGSSLCHILSGCGWSGDARLGKYQVDHLLSQGINRFAPHGFGADEQDKTWTCLFDGGKNPQYRAFAALMGYAERMGSLLSGGKAAVQTAVVYSGNWAGKQIPVQALTRLLMDHQVGFHLLPADVFCHKDHFHVKTEAGALRVGENRYTTVLVPGVEYIDATLAQSLEELAKAGCKVCVAGAMMPKIPGDAWSEDCAVCTVALADVLREITRDVILLPDAEKLRAYHYCGGEDVYFFVNEDSKVYAGAVCLGEEKPFYAYDGWKNETYGVKSRVEAGKLWIALYLEPGESIALVAGSREEHSLKAIPCGGKAKLVGKWKRSVCKAENYPAFEKGELIREFEDYGLTDRNFVGIIAYDTSVSLRQRRRAVLEITDAGSSAELFVNGQSAGIQVTAPMRYDITRMLVPGKNTIRIEVATNMERLHGKIGSCPAPIGILGQVNLYTERVYE